VVVALLVGAWLVLSLRANALQARGEAVLERARSGEATNAQLERGRDLLRQARRFNADKRPLLDEALLLSSVGRHATASVVIDKLVEEEPDNFEAWVVVYLGALEAGHETRAREAYRKVRALNPLVARTLPPARHRS
jgi:hypothetical protein